MSSPSPSRRTLAAAVLALVCVVLGVAYLPWGPSTENDTDPDDDPVEESWAFYEERPYYQRPRPPTEVPEGLPDMRAETCGGCHQDIYEEWRISTHRRAYLDDAQFLAELEKSRSENNPDSDDDVGWMCVNCHTPMMNQLDELVVGLEDGDVGQPIYRDNPHFDEKMQEEAITCATCHVRDGTVYGPYGDTDAPHPTARDPNLRDESACTDCHQAEHEWPERNLGCYFTTGEEFAGSTHSETEETCQSCHMPEVERKLAEGFDRPKRKTRRHWFGGSLIPKHPDFEEELEPLQEVYGSGVTIDLIEPEGDEPTGEADPDYHESSTNCADGDDCTSLWVRLDNEHAGHNFPTGDPERHAIIEATATDADGEQVAHATDLIGSRYKWWPDIEKLTDNRIASGETHDVALDVPLVDGVEIEIVAHKYRMFEEAVEHHDLEGEYVRGRKFHESRWKVDEDGTPSLIEISDDWGERDTLEPDATQN
ncbi:MAG: multiheme c-type cytochrome [Persicimonas sp.]